jgi:hypothetical protein
MFGEVRETAIDSLPQSRAKFAQFRIWRKSEPEEDKRIAAEPRWPTQTWRLLSATLRFKQEGTEATEGGGAFSALCFLPFLLFKNQNLSTFSAPLRTFDSCKDR